MAVSTHPPLGAEYACQCGCGGLTRNEFCPGHDAALQSELWKAVQSAKSTPEQRVKAAIELYARGWFENPPAAWSPVTLVLRQFGSWGPYLDARNAERDGL